MKIDNVRIRLFGKLANKDYGPIDPGLTVVFGENESGKTTLKEFVRTTLFDLGRKRKGLYPQPATTDAGEVDCVTDDGERFTLTRKGNKITSSTGITPESLTGITPEVYQKVYAMNPEDLIDTELVASGDIKRRFLTIPGGENMPQISEELKSGMGELLNESSMTRVRGIGKTIEDIRIKNDEIEFAKSIGSEYEALTNDEAEVESELNRLKTAQKQRQDIVDRVTRHSTQKETKSTISKLTEKRKEMDDADKAPADGMETYNTLKRAVDDKLRIKNEAEESLESIREKIGNANPEALAENRDKILGLNENIGAYNIAKSMKTEAEEKAMSFDSKISALVNEHGLTDELINNADTGQETLQRAKEPSQKAEKSFIPPIIAFLLGGILMVSAFFADVTALYAIGAILIAIGAVLVLIPGKKDGEDDFSLFISSKGFPKNTSRTGAIHLSKIIDDVRSLKEIEASHTKNALEQSTKIQEFETDLANILNKVGWTPMSFEDDVRRLGSAAGYVSGLTTATASVEKASKVYNEASLILDGYLTPYGSKEELERIVELRAGRNKLDEELRILNETLKGSGVDPDEELPEIPEDLREDIGSLQIRLGEIRTNKRKILEDSDTENLYTEKSALEAELAEEIRRWGVLSMEQTIANRASDELYEEMQPAVVQTADRYLGMMTDGEYRMDNSLRSEEVAVRSGTEVKTGDQWSSGLAGQVCLSLKLAVAKELSKETLPIMLDDVLLVFDSERKKGACKALAEVAEEMQIMLFTCDRETYEFMTEIGAETIRMKR